jgi:hypothetical protein
MLCAKLERSDTIVSRLSRELTELKTHSLKYNLIFNFDQAKGDCKEAEGENCIALVKRFISNVMSVPNAPMMYVHVAHRLGQRRPGAIRPILAKFLNVHELQTVLKHTNRLRGTKHFVQRQIPPDVTERKNLALDEFKAKRGDVQNKARLVNEKLFIKGKLQTKYQAPKPPTVTVMFADPDQTDWVFDVGESGEVDDTWQHF